MRSRSLNFTMCSQRVAVAELAKRRLTWSSWERNEDLTRRTDMFSKVGSLTKEWEADICPKEPGVVAKTTADGYCMCLPFQVSKVLSCTVDCKCVLNFESCGTGKGGATNSGLVGVDCNKDVFLLTLPLYFLVGLNVS